MTLAAVDIDPRLLLDVEAAVMARQGRAISATERRFTCPSHEDRNPSARWNTDKAVWHCDSCGAGGGAIDLANRLEVPITRSLGGAPTETIHVGRVNGYAESAPLGPVLAEYVYENVDGSPRLLVRRHTPNPLTGKKEFRIHRPDGASGWIPGLGDVSPCLYKLPNVTAAVESSDPVVGAEGEKDADSLTQLGLCGTTSPMGAGKFRPEYADALVGATVWWFIDRDEPGRKHGQDVAQKCHGKVAAFKILEPPAPHKDVTEWVEAGGTREGIEQLAASTPDWKPHLSPAEPTSQDSSPQMRSWWDIVGLAIGAPPRQIVEGLIAEDELAMVYAFGGTGKSLFALELALAVHRGESFLGRFATAQCRVGIVDEESAPGRLGGRLAQIARAHDIEPGDAQMPVFEVAKGHRVDTEAGLAALWRLVEENNLELLVIDTMRRVHQLPENDSDGMSKVVEALLTLRRRARTTLGHPLTIILIHHSPKPRESGNAAETMARGSGDIFAAVDSAIYIRKVKVASGEGERDELIVEHAKARWSEPVKPFRLIVDGDEESVRLTYAGEASDEVRQSARAEQLIKETLAQVASPTSRKALIAAGQSVGIAQRTLMRSLKEMVRKGAVQPIAQGREKTFRLTGDGALL